MQLPTDTCGRFTLAAGLAESLTAIHGAGVVHRDLKPSNVLLGEDGPCVIDFGISVSTNAGHYWVVEKPPAAAWPSSRSTAEAT